MPDVTKISHGLTIGDLKFGNARPGVVEATLKPGETMEEALDQLDDRLNAWHRKRYPHLYQEEKYPQPFPNPDRFTHMTSGQIPPTKVEFGGPPPVLNIEEERKEVMDTIDKCATLEELKAWKSHNQTVHGKIHNHYTKRLNELSNG